ALFADHRGVGERHFHGRPDLLLDALDELLDTSGRRQRLLALEANQRGLGLSVRKVEVDHAAQEQHSADEQEQDGHVLAEEPSARDPAFHRRMTSARKRIWRGAVRPKASTVLRLTARMTRSAPSTGRVRESVPRRIFQTSRAAWTPCAR